MSPHQDPFAAVVRSPLTPRSAPAVPEPGPRDPARRVGLNLRNVLDPGEPERIESEAEGTATKEFGSGPRQTAVR